MQSPLFRTALAFACAVALAAPARAAGPFAFDATPGRLPKTVVPLDYRIAVTPDPAAKTLTGSETVVLDVRRPAERIEFNTLNLTVRSARVDGAPVARVRTQNDAQLTTLTLARPLAPGRHILALDYAGKIESSAQGLFAQPYVAPNGRKGLMLSTQFESTDARRMFPAWDEPAFRATFQLSVTLPAAWTAVSNTPVVARVAHGARATTTFARTPRMASYLMVLSAGDLAAISATSADGVRHEIVAVRGQERDGAYALANSQQILTAYDDYFGTRYPLAKLSSIAVPGGFEGAMENWGGITYNDQILLLRPTATLRQKQEIYAVQAHEMAHQWFGDLVTMAWWDDLWLNESFASWMAAKQTDRANPSWDWWEGQDADKERAMNGDARTTSHKLQQPILNELEADAAFDPEITYAKGQAFLRMTEAYLGEDTFRAGIRRYVAARKFSSATAADLWNALSAASGKDVGAIAGSWTTQPGFPLVSVRARCDAAGNRTIALSQKRFLLGGSDPANPRWNVPMHVASGASGAAQTVLFATDGQTLAAGRCGEPLRANAGDVGYYRVAYDAATFADNQRAFGTLPEADKIALLDDQWALARAGQAPLSAYLSLAGAMKGDFDARAWEQITTALAALERDERGGAGHATYLAYARSVLAPVQSVLGWDAKPGETPGLQQLRRTVNQDLGAWDDPATIAEARKRFAAFVADRNALSPDDQPVVLGIVAQHADRAAFDALHAIAKSARDEGEARRFYTALMMVRDPALARQALGIAVSSEIPPQSEGSRFELVGTAADANPALAWAFFSTHSNAVLRSQTDVGRVIAIAQYVPVTYWDAAPLDQLEGWVKGHTPAAAAQYVTRGLERARSQVAEKRQFVPAADGYVADQRPAFTTGGAAPK
jgi:aminopeptidase N